MNSDFYKKTVCRLCDSKRLSLVIQLTPTPPGNHFVTREQLSAVQTSYPLEVYFCEDCHHLQLGHVVNPEFLYQNHYSYVSGTSPVFVKHLREYARYICERFSVAKSGLIVDIGSNDGTALRFFKEAGYNVLGVDPATEIVQKANENGIRTVCRFFDLEVAKQCAQESGPAALINSHNACAHIDDLSGVIAGVKHWLAADGLFVLEVGYLLDIYENVWFDTIYHEHLDFHSVDPLVKFLSHHGLEVISAQRISPQGGSIRLISQKAHGPHTVDASVQELIARERAVGLDKAEIFRAFNQNIDRVKQGLAKLIKELKMQNRTIAGYGAPTKATTLLTHFDLGNALDFIVDDNPLKQNLYSPGHHIPVYPASELYVRPPDYLLILAWNFAADIMNRHKQFRDRGGRFIIPMPEARICE